MINFNQKFVESIRAIIFLGLLLTTNYSAANESKFQFQVLVEVENQSSSGCEVRTGNGAFDSQHLRYIAQASHTTINSMVREKCVNGVWQVEASANVNAPVAIASIRAGLGDNGTDEIEWQIPNSSMGSDAYTIQVVAETTSPDSNAMSGVDRFEHTGFYFDALMLNATEAIMIPALNQIGSLVFILGLFAITFIQKRKQSKKVTQIFAVLAMIIAMPSILFFSTKTASSADTTGIQQITTDPLNDVFGKVDAAIDLAGFSAHREAEYLKLKIALNNIENDGLQSSAKILFIGNSLTSSNNVPALLTAIAKQAGKTLNANAVIQGGASLEDIFRSGRAQTEIARGGNALVVMQQGPSSLPASQLNLKTWAAKYATLIRSAGARPALYMVWPDANRFEYFDDVHQSYSNAALTVDGMFIPAGEAWLTAWSINPQLELYGSDDFHPSLEASYLVALSMFSEMYRQSPVGLPDSFNLANGQQISFSNAAVLQNAAWKTHLEFGRAGN